MEDPVLPARWAILDVHDGQVLGLLRGRGLETPQRPAKDPAPMLRADTTAPVFNDEEKPARATAQVHKVARVRYRSDVGGSAFYAGCNRATTLIAVARHVEIHRLPHGACQPSRKRFAPSLGRRGRMCGRSRGKRSLSSALEWGGIASPGQRLTDRLRCCAAFRELRAGEYYDDALAELGYSGRSGGRHSTSRRVAHT